MTFSADCPKCQGDSKPENISEGLWKVFMAAGPMYLKDSSKLLSVFTDVAPELKRERNLLEMFIGLKGPERLIQAAANGDAESAIRIMVRDPRENYGMYEGTAEQLCRSYLAALTGNVIDLSSQPMAQPDSEPAKPLKNKDKKQETFKEESKSLEAELGHDPIPGEQPMVQSAPKKPLSLWSIGVFLGFGGASWFLGEMLYVWINIIVHQGYAFHPTLIYHFLFSAACAVLGLFCCKKIPENQRSLCSVITVGLTLAFANENLRYLFILIGPHFALEGCIALILVPLIPYLLSLYFIWASKDKASSPKAFWIGVLALLGTIFSVCWLTFALYFCRGRETILCWTAIGYIGIGIGIYMLSRLQGVFKVHCDLLAGGIYISYFAVSLYWLLIGYSRFGELSTIVMLLLALPTLGLSIWKFTSFKNLQ